MSALVDAPGTTDLIARLRRLLSSANLECTCRTTLGRALDRFTVLERRRQVRSALRDARARRDEIVAKLAFLTELNDITEHEPDQTAFDELAVLFDEICDAASAAAAAIRSSTPMQATGTDCPPRCASTPPPGQT